MNENIKLNQKQKIKRLLQYPFHKQLARHLCEDNAKKIRICPKETQIKYWNALMQNKELDIILRILYLGMNCKTIKNIL